ncbi:L,D-transpeptidase family protein [Streptomyces sp. MS06]|uniref:L,D-transpeptidase family protein n=1 Tax=Streptomyces sp. MS06 TaxID=3385974 RepID=UPI00399F7750
MRDGGGGGRVVAAAVAFGVIAAALTGCGGPAAGQGGEAAAASGPPATSPSADAADPTHVPGVGDRLRKRIPDDSGQVVAVYGDGRDSANATLVLYTRSASGGAWKRARSWPAHNGTKGWTPDHHEGDKRTPVGVYTLTDAGGVLKDPGSKLPYTRSAAFAAPRSWGRAYWHDFDYVIAIDYNRVKHTPPNDPTRPQGRSKGGSIWIHMDHGRGTSACVSVSKSAMEYLLRTLDPARHPVVVMGDRADLAA